MWLKYGVAPNRELVSIHEASQGKTQLTCLYCGGELTAKKGSVKEHHFFHTTETYKPVHQRIKKIILFCHHSCTYKLSLKKNCNLPKKPLNF